MSGSRAVLDDGVRIPRRMRFEGGIMCRREKGIESIAFKGNSNREEWEVLFKPRCSHRTSDASIASDLQNLPTYVAASDHRWSGIMMLIVVYR